MARPTRPSVSCGPGCRWTGGGPFTVPTKEANYKYQDIIILMSDGLNTAEPLGRQRLVAIIGESMLA